MEQDDAAALVQELRDELRHTQRSLAYAESNLRCLSEGVRVIASQLKQADRLVGCSTKASAGEDDVTVATDADTTVSEEDSSSVSRGRTLSTHSLDPAEVRLSELSEQLSAVPAADLLALQNAAHMIQEHARLASEEASVAVNDTIHAKSAEQEWMVRALAAEELLAHLQIENAKLKQKTQKLSVERRVLVKEVRKNHKELQDAKQQDMWKQLEVYVTSALSIHEYQLKSKPASAVNLDESSVVSEVKSVRSQSIDEPSERPTPVPTEQQPEEKTISSASKPEKASDTSLTKPDETASTPENAASRGSAQPDKPASETAPKPQKSGFFSPRLSAFGGSAFGGFPGYKRKAASTPKKPPADSKPPPPATAAPAVAAQKTEEATTPKTTSSSQPDFTKSPVPHNFVSIAGDASFDSRLSSPVTYLESPHDGSQAYRDVSCDPHVLRSLALPSVNHDG